MRFQGPVYRAHNPQWSWTPLSGEGARRHGGRFNRRGVPALYTSLAPLTALREASPLGRPMQPLTLCAYEVDAGPVFDATDRRERGLLGVTESDLACPRWEAEMLAGALPASQALADRLIAAGHVGMLVRSFAGGAGDRDLNLVMWRWGKDLPARIVLIDDENRLSGPRSSRYRRRRVAIHGERAPPPALAKAGVASALSPLAGPAPSFFPSLLPVMPGLVPGIPPRHSAGRTAAWMPGTSPGMTKWGAGRDVGRQPPATVARMQQVPKIRIRRIAGAARGGQDGRAVQSRTAVTGRNSE